MKIPPTKYIKFIYHFDIISFLLLIAHIIKNGNTIISKIPTKLPTIETTFKILSYNL